MKIVEKMTIPDGNDSPFKNSLLVAMPSLQDGSFRKSVIYLCAHSDEGAMGIVINQSLPNVAFGDLLSQLNLPRSELVVDPVIHFGGPVDMERGFVLHSTDFIRAETVRINDGLCMTGTIDILSAMAEGRGPKRALFALGYAGWGPGQLEAEIKANSWLVMPVDDDLLFGADLDGKWEKAMLRLGIRASSLSSEAGHA